MWELIIQHICHFLRILILQKMKIQSLALCILYIYKNHLGFAISWYSKMPKLNSFYGSVACGTFGCMLIAFAFLQYAKRNYFWLMLGCGLLTACLSLQRSAMICAIFIVIALIFYFLKKNIIKKSFIISFVSLVFLLFATLGLLYPEVLNALFVRFMQVPYAVGERSHSWLNAFSNGLGETIFGMGFATGGQRAIGYSVTTVNDGNYFKIIYELGIIGLLLWCSIVLSILKCYRTFLQFPYLIASIAFMVQLIGSNLLTFYSTALLFWYCLGRVVGIYRQNKINGVYLLYEKDNN